MFITFYNVSILSINYNIRKQREIYAQVGNPDELADQVMAQAIKRGEYDAALNGNPMPATPNAGHGGSAALISQYMARDLAKEAPKDEKGNLLSPKDGSKFTDFFKAELNDGSAYVTFKYVPAATESESFSNSTKQSDIQGKINGISSSSSDKKFSFNGLAKEGVIGGVITALGDLATGIADGVGVSGLMTLGGAGFIDIPEHWDTSTSKLPATSFKIQLRASGGSKAAIFSDIYVPLAMLLAGALPQSTGPSSYATPFLLEMFSQNRAQVRLGMIDSLNITRGTGSLGWSVDGLPLGIDIDLSIKDLSGIMHAPITDGGGLLDDHTVFTDYMAVLGGLSLADQAYNMPNVYRSIQNTIVSFNQTFTYANWAMKARQTLPGRVMSAVSRTRAG